MRLRLHALPVVAMMLMTLPAFAQTTTGRLIGKVVDEQGEALPGATVTLNSSVLIGGAQTKIADGAGEFTFLSLFPGDYTVKVDLSGYVSQERQEIKVPLGGAASVIVALQLGTFTDEITVVAETPVVDPTQVNTGQVYDQSYLQEAAIGSSNRGYQYILSQTAGVTGGSNPNVFGSTDGENAYYIDGQDTTDPVTATWGVIFNYDSIAEVQFQTSGFEAEYGRATGGLVNVVTKSGGNQFNGTLDIRYRNDGFQESGEHYDASILDSAYQDIGATLGGPVLRDKLWFFAAYEYINSESTPIGSPTTRDWEGTNYNGKLTWQASSGWRLIGRFSGSPADISNDNASQWVTPDAAAFQTQGTDLYTAELNGVLSDSLMWNTVVGAYRSALDVVPMSGDLVTASHYNFDTGLTTGNYSNQQYSKRNRDDLATDLTWFVDQLAGSHEFKVGLQFSDTDFPGSSCSTGTAGGACAPGSVGYSFDDIEWGGAVPYFMTESTTVGTQTYKGQMWTGYVQDAWRILPSLTLKLGVRYDQVAYDNNDQRQIADMTKWQPRVGVAWDITNDSKNVLRGNWGQFMHPANLVLPWVLRAGLEPSFRYYSCSTIVNGFWGVGVSTPEECEDWANAVGFGYSPGYEGWDPLGWVLHPAEVYGLGETLVQPDLNASYAETLSLSFEREVGRRASIELTYVDKKTLDLFEDTCAGNVPVPEEGAGCLEYYLGNLPDLSRDYEGIILKYETRTFDWLTLFASYTYSKSKGNLDDSYEATAAFDVYPYHFVNRYGYLADHRLQRFKLNGFFAIKGDWNIGFDGWWSSNFTWQPVANEYDDPAIPYDVMYLEPRGSRDGADYYQLDLQLSKGFTISNVRLVLIGTVYNTFSSENATAVCSDIGGCGSYETGDYTNWQTPRRYEVGFRFEF